MLKIISAALTLAIFGVLLNLSSCIRKEIRLQYFKQTVGDDAPQKIREVVVFTADPLDSSPLQISRPSTFKTPLG